MATHRMSCDELAIEINGSSATLTLNRPQVMNAFDRAQRLRLDAALRSLDEDGDVRVLVITGGGRAFCAGQDQHESAAMDAAASAQRIDDYMSLYRTVRALRKPMIAWVNGVAAGAGLQIALMCDLRIASTAARIGMTELKVGSVAVTGSFLLNALVGEAVMRRMVLLTEVLDAKQSFELGLLHEVLEPDRCAARVTEICDQLSALPSVTTGSDQEVVVGHVRGHLRACRCRRKTSARRQLRERELQRRRAEIQPPRRESLTSRRRSHCIVYDKKMDA